MIITPETIASDKAIMKIASSYKSQVSPINIAQITKYISLSTPNSILGFSYQKEMFDIEDIRAKFSEIQLPSKPLKKLYQEKISESIQKFELAQAVGTEDFAEKSQKVYGFPSKKLISTAYDLLSLEKGPIQKKISLIEAKQILKEELSNLGLPWKVQSRKMLSYANVQPAKSTVTLCSTHRFSERNIKRLAVHEIGTHSVRSMNARLQPLLIFRNFPHYIETEEGLAAFNEEITGYLFNDTIRKYAGRVVAVEYAQEHTLKETYKFLQKYFPNPQALNIAIRVKRGLPNTDTIGAFTKDYVYLKGFLDVRKYLQREPLKHLYYGKISLPWIDLVKKLEPELTPIRYFPPLLQAYETKKEIL